MFWFAIAFLALLVIEAFGLPDIFYTRNGGIRFLRVHRLQISFCVCRETADQKRRKALRS